MPPGGGSNRQWVNIQAGAETPGGALGGLSVAPWQMAETEAGRLFRYIATGGNQKVLLRVGSAGCWLLPMLVSDEAATLSLYEGPTLTGQGTAMVAINANREDADGCPARAFYGATTSDDGDLLAITQHGANLPPAAPDGWFYLAPDTLYLIVATDVGTPTADYIELVIRHDGTGTIGTTTTTTTSTSTSTSTTTTTTTTT